MIKGALISDCEKYRFQLWRIWDESKPLVLFIMHNPSTANHNDDDPTIRRCIGYAKDWGYGGFYVGNLSPYRATLPSELIGKDLNIITPKANAIHIKEMESRCQLKVLAHGNSIVKFPSSINTNEDWHYLKLTQYGNACHPLYLKRDLKPIRFPVVDAS